LAAKLLETEMSRPDQLSRNWFRPELPDSLFSNQKSQVVKGTTKLLKGTFQVWKGTLKLLKGTLKVIKSTLKV
jgi:hypothetical protein